MDGERLNVIQAGRAKHSVPNSRGLSEENLDYSFSAPFAPLRPLRLQHGVYVELIPCRIPRTGVIAVDTTGFRVKPGMTNNIEPHHARGIA